MARTTVKDIEEEIEVLKSRTLQLEQKEKELVAINEGLAFIASSIGTFTGVIISLVGVGIAIFTT